MKKWIAIIIAIFVTFAFLLICIEIEKMLVFWVYIGLLLLLGIVILVYKLFFGDEKKVDKSSLKKYEVKYVFALDLMESFDIDIFSVKAKPRECKYHPNPIVQRFFQRGEEVWAAKIMIKDKRYFGGEETKIVMFIDKNGYPNSEFILNTTFGFDSELWHNPQKWLTEGVSKIPKPGTIKDVLKEHLRNTGTLPEGIDPFKLEDKE